MRPSDFRRAQREVHKIMEQMGKEPAKFDAPLPAPKKPIQIDRVAIDVTPAKPGEYVIYQSKPHWSHLFRAIVFVIFGLTCTLCTMLVATTEPPPGQPQPSEGMIQFYITCSACILALALFSTITASLRYINSDFVLTNKRVIYKQGGFRQKTLEIFMAKIDSVGVETSILGRLLGYGTIVIMSGASTQQLRNFSSPQQIRNAIANQVPR